MSLQPRCDLSDISFYTFWFSFLLSNSRGKELLTKIWTVLLSLPFAHFLHWRIFFLPFWSFILTLNMRRSRGTVYFSWSSTSLSRHPSSSSPSPLPDESRCGCFYWRVEHYSWAMFSHWISFIRFLVALVGRYLDFFVTKNPHSPRVWSADVSSKVDRGGSRSTSQSSLCLD